MNKERPSRKPLMIQYLPSSRQSFNDNLDKHLFMEDVHLGIMPIGITSKSTKEFNVLFKGTANDQELAKRICLSLTEHNHHLKPQELISDLVETIAKHLSLSGKSYYEIINDKDDQCCPYLHWFTSKNLFKLPGKFLQIIPQKDINRFNRKFSIINSSAVWEITMPHILGGYRGYRNILKKLENINSLTPKFANDKITLILSTPGYDLKAYKKNIEIFINRTTGKWGWNHRNISNENYTEFYSVYKHISFAWAKSVLREHIIEELNTLISRLGIQCVIETQGLPKSADIMQTRDELVNGKIDFDKAFKLVSLY